MTAFFIGDYNTASVAIHRLYQTHGQIWTLIVPKMDVIADLFTLEEASLLIDEGAIQLNWPCYEPAKRQIILTAIGACQLEEVLKASVRLKERKVPHSVVYMIEPGRFRYPRSERERAHNVSESLQKRLYPDSVPARIFVTHKA